MMNDRENWRNTETPHRDIVAGTMERMIAAGTTRIRTYAQVDADCKLERLESVLFAKEKFAHHAHTQNIAFPQAGLLREEGSVEVLEEGLKNGADVVGGIDPCQLDRHPRVISISCSGWRKSIRWAWTSTFKSQASWACSAPN